MRTTDTSWTGYFCISRDFSCTVIPFHYRLASCTAFSCSRSFEGQLAGSQWRWWYSGLSDHRLLRQHLPQVLRRILQKSGRPCGLQPRTCLSAFPLGLLSRCRGAHWILPWRRLHGDSSCRRCSGTTCQRTASCTRHRRRPQWWWMMMRQQAGA